MSSHPQSAGEVRAASLLDMTDQRPTDAEMDELVAELAAPDIATKVLEADELARQDGRIHEVHPDLTMHQGWRLPRARRSR
jgi:hypothetical protein